MICELFIELYPIKRDGLNRLNNTTICAVVPEVFYYHIGMRKLLALFTLFFCAQLYAQPFDGLSDEITNGDYGNLKAVVISRHGEIIYEDYFRGTLVNELHVLNSVTKSIGSALIGIANRQGKIQPDDELPKFFQCALPDEHREF